MIFIKMVFVRSVVHLMKFICLTSIVYLQFSFEIYASFFVFSWLEMGLKDLVSLNPSTNLNRID